MIIDINGQSYEVPADYRDKLINQMWAMLMSEYEKIPEGYRIMGMALTRKMLYGIEKDLSKSHGKEMALQVARPAKGADPNTHLLWVMTGAIREGLSNATFTIETSTENAGEVSAFNISIPTLRQDTDASGGPATVNGHIGVGENDSIETPGQRSHPSVSD
jgi:hypothetical protein